MRVALWDTALKFLSPGPRNDVTDHLDGTACAVIFGICILLDSSQISLACLGERFFKGLMDASPGQAFQREEDITRRQLTAYIYQVS